MASFGPQVKNMAEVRAGGEREKAFEDMEGALWSPRPRWVRSPPTARPTRASSQAGGGAPSHAPPRDAGRDLRGLAPLGEGDCLISDLPRGH
ncbi:hypothetical protein MC885_011158 [Smutsia gigantea]|nr:hypothetical protein MC885_011158 [Smutsia gigantea]